MPADPQRPNRRSLRLPHYDYASQGSYFVTLCIHERVYLLGDMDGGQLRLTEAGRMVDTAWLSLPTRFPTVSLDAHVVMPNHLHGVIMIPTAPPQPAAPLLGQVVGSFKSLTTHNYIAGVREQGWPGFAGKLWQRNYYEHIVRDEANLRRIRDYIEFNPTRWADDPENAWRQPRGRPDRADDAGSAGRTGGPAGDDEPWRR